MSFQVVGTRATIAKAPAHFPLTHAVQRVFIAGSALGAHRNAR
jgi:hypothetical protein